MWRRRRIYKDGIVLDRAKGLREKLKIPCGCEGA